MLGVTNWGTAPPLYLLAVQRSPAPHWQDLPLRESPLADLIAG